MSYLVALALTLAIELPIYLALLRLSLKVPPGRALFLALAGNLLTHPLVWFVTPIVPSHVVDYDLALTAAEVLAMITEALVLRMGIRQRFSRLLIVSFAANAASLLVGSAFM
jgi:hypothetical protein